MEKESEIDVVGLFWTVWEQKYLVLAVSLVFGVIAAILALTAIPLFRAQVIVTEVHDTGIGGSGGGLMGEIGGLASIAGIDLSANGQSAEREAVLQSRGLVDSFVRRYQLTPLINGKSATATEWNAVELFRTSVLDLHDDKLKQTTTITMDWKDPAVAARWANDFVALANELLRTRAIEESTSNIEYLNKQLGQTNVVEIQQAIYHLIEGETKSLMLAHSRVQYAFTIVDPAVTPEVRVSPRRTLMVISGLFIGGVFGSLIAWARKAARRRASTATN
jgi:uncharacterized protein involved in exopolysaccharide biosynthesis